MTDDPPDPAPRNRRFLVSLWQPAGARGPVCIETVRGVVWEADPRDPGRIDTPRSFIGLQALPTTLIAFLEHDEGCGEEDAP